MPTTSHYHISTVPRPTACHHPAIKGTRIELAQLKYVFGKPGSTFPSILKYFKPKHEGQLHYGPCFNAAERALADIQLMA